MDKEYVPYELAEKLKNIGFNEKCSGNYMADGELIIRIENYRSKDGEIDDRSNYVICDFNTYGNGVISAPLWQQAFEWILKEYHLDVRIVQQTMKWSDFSIHRILHSDEDEEFYFRSDIMKRDEVRKEAMKKVIEVIENEN